VFEHFETKDRHELNLLTNVPFSKLLFTFQTMMNCLWFGDDVGTSVEKKRIHDQLMPNLTSFEQGFDEVTPKSRFDFW